MPTSVESAVESLHRASAPQRRGSLIALVVGAGLVLTGAIIIVAAPAEKPFASDGWFEAAKAHGDAIFAGVGLVMAGGFITVVGLSVRVGASRSAQRLRLTTLDAMAGTVARAVGGETAQHGAPSAAERLRQLDELKRAGLITPEEYAAKRHAIIVAL